jgi:5'-3' exonuclease
MAFLIFDLDSFVYRAAWAAQKLNRYITVEGEDQYRASFTSAKERDEWLKNFNIENYDETKEYIVESVDSALVVASILIKEVLNEYGATEYVAFLSGDHNFREALYPLYKANRQQERPVHYQAVRDYYINRWNAEVVDGIEADDAVAMTWCDNPFGKVIVSEDKDFQQLPARIYIPSKQKEIVVDPLQASVNFYSQLLTGDASDNIPGIYGIGPKKASAILDGLLSPRERYIKVLTLYHDTLHAGMDDEEVIATMHLRATLLHLLRSWNDEWQPPTWDTGSTGAV